MSALRRSLKNSNTSYLPGSILPPADEREEEGAEVVDDASSTSSTGTIVLPSRTTGRRASTHQEPYGEVSWKAYFKKELYFPSPSISYHAYITPPMPECPLFVLHHGAGSSGLSFSTLAVEIGKLLPGAGILSFDVRGHGTSVDHEFKDGGHLDMSLEILSKDMAAILKLVQENFGWPELPPLILVGHSLGGAVVTDIAHQGIFGNRVLGYAVLDVVEGSAIDALMDMQYYLSSRPPNFASLEQGIEWHVRSRTLRNPRSARVSVPGLLLEDSISTSDESRWVWRTDLSATEPFWKGWFTGLSKKFLAAKGGKLLLLAGTDRLDKELMIGQMQGKYQLQVFPDAGHFVHEDLPEKTAGLLVEFYRRNDRTPLVLPPKVGYIPQPGNHT
ncbi:MAG: Protein phosphatase methylesterase 1 [Trizodia sp. TS-e1964]|nr:MAG: Protein phosphatase methylesterase 1 [Trizodia sp. TS-e1964]